MQVQQIYHLKMIHRSLSKSSLQKTGLSCLSGFVIDLKAMKWNHCQ